MTSQKRFRQHQESNKNNSRFRDLPPRFKRQKSAASSAEESTVTPVAADTQTEAEINLLPAANKTDSPQPEIPKMAPSIANVCSAEESLQNQVRPSADTYQIPASTVSSWQWPAKSEYVLSQWDHRQFNRASNVQPPPIPLGTRFGYKIDSPPLSPWASRNVTNLTGQFGMSGSPTWLPPASDLCTGQGIHSPSMYFNNENWAPNHNLIYPHSPGGTWAKPATTQHLYTAPSVVLQDQTPVASRYVENRNASDRSSGRQQVDYSDPDIRTIEMLRELERVADEKDSEDFGVDRKSLVSHHLRMLMCAVDKYTEGIEDGMTEISRQGMVSVASDSGESSPRTSPGPSQAKEKQTKINKQKAAPEFSHSLWSSGNENSSWNNLEIPQASLAAGHVVRIQNHRSSQQHAHLWEQPYNIDGQNIAWDLWSSPSFDFSGLLNQNLDDLTRNPFSRFKESDEKRKPLYQR